MIPSTWVSHVREDDGEHVGYLAPHEADRCVPVTLFGYRLGAPGDEDDARETLDAVGLSVLAEPWLLSLEDRADPLQVQIVEVTPRTLVLQSVDFGSDGEYGRRFTLDVPVPDGVLRPARKLAF